MAQAASAKYWKSAGPPSSTSSSAPTPEGFPSASRLSRTTGWPEQAPASTVWLPPERRTSCTRGAGTMVSGMDTGVQVGTVAVTVAAPAVVPRNQKLACDVPAPSGSDVPAEAVQAASV